MVSNAFLVLEYFAMPPVPPTPPHATPDRDIFSAVTVLGEPGGVGCPSLSEPC